MPPQAAVPLVQAARRAILISGTPAMSRPEELYTLVRPQPARSPVHPNPASFTPVSCTRMHLSGLPISPIPEHIQNLGT